MPVNRVAFSIPGAEQYIDVQAHRMAATGKFLQERNPAAASDSRGALPVAFHDSTVSH